MTLHFFFQASSARVSVLLNGEMDDAVVGETEEEDDEDGGGTKGAGRLFVWRCQRLKAEGETLAGMVSHAPDQLLFAFINYMCGNL